MFDDTQLFQNISGATASFQLFGGTYVLVQINPSDNYALQILLPDGATWVTFNGSGASVLTMDNVPPGTYRFNGTAAGGYFSLVRVSKKFS